MITQISKWGRRNKTRRERRVEFQTIYVDTTPSRRYLYTPSVQAAQGDFFLKGKEEEGNFTVQKYDKHHLRLVIKPNISRDNVC